MALVDIEIEDARSQPAPPPATTLEALKQSFPFETIRPAQDSSLAVVAQAYDTEKPFTILEIPTGGGKSGIGMASGVFAATHIKDGSGAHYLTSQNSLSSQLVRDFQSRGLVEVRGKRNYSCVRHKPQSCDTGSTMNGGGRSCDDCPYRAAKTRYVNGKLGVTNYSYYLTETMHQGDLTPRDYLVLDEAHNIEREILSLVNITITQHKVSDLEGGRLPVFGPNEDPKVRHWIENTFIPKVRKYLEFLDNEIEIARNNNERIPTKTLHRAMELRQMLENLELYLNAENPQDWLAWSDNQGALCIKPLTAAEFAQRYLFSHSPHVLMMSATILDFDTFRRNLGIRKSAAMVHAMPSDFPLANRRIVYWPAGSMSAKNLDASLPLVAQRIDAVLGTPKYTPTKGIIHTHSYKINSYLNDALAATQHRRRILTHSNSAGSREDAIERHYVSEDPTVLMSPSMTEGLDLKGDLSRIQFITKVPYPFLDPYNRTRMERDPKWYQLQTALALVQASGRSVRSIDDYATTIILDADFGRFLSQNQDILPKWWLDSIEFR